MSYSKNESELKIQTSTKEQNDLSAIFEGSPSVCWEVSSQCSESGLRLGRYLLSFLILPSFPKVRYTLFCDVFD